MWAGEEHFFCEAPRANSPNDPPIEPTKIFDSVYVIGNQGTAPFIVRSFRGAYTERRSAVLSAGRTHREEPCVRI